MKPAGESALVQEKPASGQAPSAAQPFRLCVKIASQPEAAGDFPFTERENLVTPRLESALVAQLVEHLICNQGVAGSNPAGGTINFEALMPPPRPRKITGGTKGANEVAATVSSALDKRLSNPLRYSEADAGKIISFSCKVSRP
jgi:hypothetical protein